MPNKKIIYLFIGSCGFSPPDKQQNCECFYALLPEYWGQGFATEAMTKLLDYGFNKLEIKGVKAHIKQDNLGSIKVAEKLGMNCQGLVDFTGVPEAGKLFFLTQKQFIARMHQSLL